MSWRIKKNRRIISHILFWNMLWLFYVFFFSYNFSNKTLVFIFSTFLIPITAIPTYLTVYILTPKYLNTKRYIWFGIYSAFIFLFTVFCIVLLIILSLAYIDQLKFENLPSMGKNYIYLTILVYFIVALLSFFNIWKKNVQIISRNDKLQNQLLTAKVNAKEQELAYLKNQIHPHFLFNVLNTIYGLALQKASETPVVVLKLSNLLDYILYQANKPFVQLSDEIHNLEQYIDLERIRFNDTLKVNFIKNIDNQDALIPPMLLLPFVENVFKHGSIINGFLSVFIEISVINHALDFRVKNTFKQTHLKNGLGLKNAKERLQILYPKDYDLQIQSDQNCFEVRLQINHLNQKNVKKN